MGKPIFGGWEFDGALAIAFLCMVAAAYLYFVERTGRPPFPIQPHSRRGYSAGGGGGDRYGDRAAG
jgi:hypothetical protein